jgi:hypothetical protein
MQGFNRCSKATAASANRYEARARALARARRGPEPARHGHRLLRQPRRPGEIFDTDPGEMFVVRNVANLVPPFETGGGRHGVSAALEFAVTQLEVGRSSSWATALRRHARRR